MKNKNICIICRKAKNNMTEEHVIPDSLGGHYKIYNVCKGCNDSLGGDVDSTLVNHNFSKFFRHNEQIKGEKGKIPFPISGYFQHPTRTDLKYKMCHGKLRQLPTPPQLIKNNDGEIIGASCSLDISDKNDANAIMKKYLSRQGLDPTQFYTQTEETIVHSDTTFSGKLNIDIRDFKIGLLKIAYEFAVDKVPKYFDDPMAIKISEILETANISEVEKLQISTGFEKIISKNFDDFFDFEKKRHLLWLTGVNNCLICFIRLYGLFEISIKLSDNSSYLKEWDMLICDNNFKNKKCVFYNLNNKLTNNIKNTYISFEHHVSSRQEYNELQNNFKYEGQGKEPKLYNSKGDVFPNAIHIAFNNKIKEAFNHKADTISVVNGFLTQIIKFDNLPPVFLKSVKTGNLFRVTAIKIEEEFEKI